MVRKSPRMISHSFNFLIMRDLVSVGGQVVGEECLWCKTRGSSTVCEIHAEVNRRSWDTGGLSSIKHIKGQLH
ncbi:hypothetical protein [Saguinine gammaherpesvirus 1]|uniref:Uncharacterized protein n=1 Tax=Saguinine gammaherpesvirus 1 TaxID=2169901 RepID=A0A9Q8VJ72_9GAMA|nr:hypothetical protein [Saguinine gammaherpesvirus 1]